MTRKWNPTLDQLVAARDALRFADAFLCQVINNVSAKCSQESIDEAQDKFEQQLVRVFDACSSEAAYSVVARQDAIAAVHHENAFERGEAEAEDREPKLIAIDEAGILVGAGMVRDQWDRESRNEHGDSVLEAALSMIRRQAC